MKAATALIFGFSIFMLICYHYGSIDAKPAPDLWNKIKDAFTDGVDRVKDATGKGFDVLNGDRKLAVEIGGDNVIDVHTSPTRGNMVLYGLGGLIGLIAIIAALRYCNRAWC